MIRLGDRLRELRGKRTQESVAKELNMAASTYSLYEQNLREPKHVVLLKLADFYGVTTDYLLGRTNIRTAQEDIACACRTIGLSEKNAELLARAKSHPVGKETVVSLLNKSVPFLASAHISGAYFMVKSLQKEPSDPAGEMEVWEMMEDGTIPDGYIPVPEAFAKQAFARQIAAEFAEYLLTEEDNDAET